MVYDFGRYGKVDWNQTTGEGIMNVYTDGNKYLQSEMKERNSVGYTSASTIDQDKLIIQSFQKQTDAGQVYRTGAVPNGGGTAYKLVDGYNIFSNNCLTKCDEGLKLVGLDLIGNEYDPRKELIAMEKSYQTSNLTRTEYNQGGQINVTYTSKPVKPVKPLDLNDFIKSGKKQAKDNTTLKEPIKPLN